MGFFKSQHWCVTDKTDDLWSVKYDLIKEGYLQFVELRGIDAGHEVVQVLADPLERQRGENGEDRACQQRRPSDFPAKVGSRRGSEIEMK